MNKFVLAIDDNPERYDVLTDRLAPFGYTLICMQNPWAVKMFIRRNPTAAILLDHDMPSVVEGEIHHEWNGMYYLENVLFGTSNVIITSANPVASSRMLEYARGLDGMIVTQIPVTQKNHVDQWVSFILDVSGCTKKL